MGSPSSPQKSDLQVTGEHAARLLRDGVVIDGPPPDILEAAERLRELGIIDPRTITYVRCADPKDADFSSSNRHCPGRIYCGQEGRNECAGEPRCPECDRPVYPDCFEKRPYRELRINVPRQGVRAYVATLLGQLPEEVKRIAEDVYRVDVGELGVVVCVADYCTDERFLTRDWASTHPTCYVVVNPRAATERFLQEDWLARVTLAEIISGQADLGELLRQTAATGIPGALKNVSVPVYSRGPLPIEIEPRRSSRRGRLFVVEVGSDGVRIEGESVMAAQADTRYQVFRILWDGFVEDLREGVPCGEFRVMNLDRIMEQLQLRTGRQIVDELSVRRTVNRLQSDLATAVKKRLGLPIDREDIIQTCRWKGQNAFEHGYRINPATVAVRPFAPSA